MPAATPASASPGTAASVEHLGGGTLQVRRLPKPWSTPQLASFLAGLGLRFASCRTEPGWPHGFVVFGFLSDRLAAEAELPLHAPDGGTPLRICAATLRGGERRGALPSEADARAAAEARARRDVRDQVCPLWRMPYAQQLARKCSRAHAAAAQLAAAVRRASAACGAAAPAWCLAAAPVPLAGIVRSPTTVGYRNKVEFTIGPGEDGRPCVGFNVGLFADGFTAVHHPRDCPHVSPAAQLAAAAVEACVRASPLPAWDKRSGSGFWRLLTVREGGLARASGRDWKALLVQPGAEEDADVGAAAAAAAGTVGGGTGGGSCEPPVLPRWEDGPAPPCGAEVLLCLQVNDGYAAPAAVLAECSRIAACLRAAAAAASPPLPLAALLLQLHRGCANGAADGAPCCPLDGYAPGGGGGGAPGASLTETLCGLRFRVSPDAFFQTNTPAAEALFELAGEWAAAPGAALAPTLLDVCCGTGTIGLTLARRFARVVGVDICAPAVADATANAALNGIHNASFVAGRAEAVLPATLRELRGGAVAVVDPPRAGLHRAVLAALRATPGVRRLVYIACNPDSLAKDATALCAPGGLRGDPFAPVRCAALDLFPHTEHVEMVLVMER